MSLKTLLMVSKRRSPPGIACVGYDNPHSGKQDLSRADVLLESFEGLTPSFFLHVWQRKQKIPVTIANTRRLIIRELTVADIPDLYPIYKDPEVAKFIDDIDDYKEMEMAKQAAYIRNVYNFYGYGLWGVFSKTSNGLIGRCRMRTMLLMDRMRSCVLFVR